MSIKKKMAVVVAGLEVEDEYQFGRRWYGGNPEQLQLLAAWLIEQQVEEVVMESAQYWKPLRETLERYGAIRRPALFWAEFQQASTVCSAGSKRVQ